MDEAYKPEAVAAVKRQLDRTQTMSRRHEWRRAGMGFIFAGIGRLSIPFPGTKEERWNMDLLGCPGLWINDSTFRVNGLIREDVIRPKSWPKD